MISNPPFQEWHEFLGTERRIDGLLAQFTHHVDDRLDMNADSYRLKQSAAGASHLANVAPSGPF